MRASLAPARARAGSGTALLHGRCAALPLPLPLLPLPRRAACARTCRAQQSPDSAAAASSQRNLKRAEACRPEPPTDEHKQRQPSLPQQQGAVGATIASCQELHAAAPSTATPPSPAAVAAPAPSPAHTNATQPGAASSGAGAAKLHGPGWRVLPGGNVDRVCVVWRGG
jgi:hypothetical protein